MKRARIGSIAIFALAALAASAQAMTLGSLDVTWNDVVKARYQWSNDGGANWSTSRVVNNGWAIGTFDGGSLGALWCVDIYNYSGTTWQARQYTQADGAASETEWITGDGDTYRSAAGLGQAAYLANHHGSEVTTTAQRHALQMAMWTAVYGTNTFRYVSGGGISAGDGSLALYEQYKAEIAAGSTAGEYEWYDNDRPDQYYQDFMNDVPAQDIPGTVPESASVLLLSGVLLGAAALGWRRRSNRAESTRRELS